MPKSNIDDFLKALEKQEKQIKERINSVIKDTVKAGYDSLLRPKQDGGTPKQTGWLRSNYLITVDKKTDAVVQDRKNVSTTAREAFLADFLSQPDLYNKKEVVINNNTPYGPTVNQKPGYQFKETALRQMELQLEKKRKMK